MPKKICTKSAIPLFYHPCSAVNFVIPLDGSWSFNCRRTHCIIIIILSEALWQLYDPCQVNTQVVVDFSVRWNGWVDFSGVWLM